LAWEAHAPESGYGIQPAPAVPEQIADRRWLTLGLLVGGLYAVGVLYAWRIGPSFSSSFSGNVTSVFLPVAVVIILFVGFSPQGYAIAAGLFYSFLPLSQAASGEYDLYGEGATALTYEMLLAVPLILTAWLGPRGIESPSRNVPRALPAACWAFVAAAAVSTLLAQSPTLALPAFASRILLPVLVTLGSARRLRNLTDAYVLWLGLAAGIAIMAVFSLQRVTTGEVLSYGTNANQRFAGASGTLMLPSLLVVGPALWRGHALAVRKSPLHGLPWIVLAGVLGLLMWLGGHRGVSGAFGLLVLWWLPGHVVRHFLSARALVSSILIGGVVAFLVVRSIQSTTVNVELTAERLTDMGQQGLYAEARWPLWVEGIGHWLSSPIWGNGQNNWALLNSGFESSHSSVVALLEDLGLLGAIPFGLIVLLVLGISRNSKLGGLAPLEQEFFRGSRAAWITLLLLLCVDLPFTSGQPRNSIFAYAVFLFPGMAMMVYTRYPRTVAWSPPAGLSAQQALPPTWTTTPVSAPPIGSGRQ